MNVFADYHRRYVLKISAIIFLSSIIIIGLNYFSIKILSSIRAYVNGESEYSKSQKDATRYLIDFIQTSDLQSYSSFKSELSVPVGDSLARLSLQRGDSYQIIRQAALQGRNHPDDIDNMIWLFEHFRYFSYFNNVIDKWTDADRGIAELDRTGEFIFSLGNEQLSAEVKAAMILNVNTINRRLTNNLQSFSTMLGEASRMIAQWLIVINVFFILLILITVGAFARNMLQKLLNSQKLVEDQNKLKDEFISIASHELRTPLTSMKASLQILERITKEHPQSKEIQPFIGSSNKQVNRLNGLVADLLDITRIQSGKLAINKKPFLLNDLINEVVYAISHTSNHPIRVAEIAKIYVNADDTRIYQVIDNFLSNAIKYSGQATDIHISAEALKGQVKISVRDTGPGIARDKLPFLFDRFYRVEGNNARAQGLGLGLYICKEIIVNHGGEVGAESEPGKGSVFWFTLPMLKVLAVSEVDA